MQERDRVAWFPITLSPACGGEGWGEGRLCGEIIGLG